jgi:hypothetical protein
MNMQSYDGFRRIHKPPLWQVIIARLLAIGLIAAFWSAVIYFIDHGF